MHDRTSPAQRGRITVDDACRSAPTVAARPDHPAVVVVSDDDRITYEPMGYGAVCSRCGALVVGREAQEVHRQYHREERQRSP